MMFPVSWSWWERLLLWAAAALQLMGCMGQCPVEPDAPSFLRRINYCNETCQKCAALPDDCFLFSQCLDEDKGGCICSDGSFQEDYESLSARKKLQHVWSLIRSTKEPNTEWQTNAITSSVLKPFQFPGDYYPEGNQKVIHGAYGAHSIVEISTAGADAHNFDGIFATGCKHAILRASVTNEFPGTMSVMGAGFGLKCFQDGSPSANLVFMNDVIPRPDFNFWNRNHSNHYELLEGDGVIFGPTLLCPLLRKFGQASSCPGKVGLLEWAFNRETGFDLCDRLQFDGLGIPNPPVAPFRLVFVPSGGFSFPSDPYCPQDFLDLMSKIPKKTKIFDVYAQLTPDTEANIKVLSIYTKTKFYPSAFGDSRLMFRHIPFERDFTAAAYDPESWRDEVNPIRECHSLVVLPISPVEFSSVDLEDFPCPFGCPIFSSPPPDSNSSASENAEEDDSTTSGNQVSQCPFDAGKKGKNGIGESVGKKSVEASVGGKKSVEKTGKK